MCSGQRRSDWALPERWRWLQRHHPSPGSRPPIATTSGPTLVRMAAMPTRQVFAVGTIGPAMTSTAPTRPATRACAGRTAADFRHLHYGDRKMTLGVAAVLAMTAVTSSYAGPRDSSCIPQYDTSGAQTAPYC